MNEVVISLFVFPICWVMHAEEPETGEMARWTRSKVWWRGKVALV